MVIELNNFESYINGKILKRGLDYWESGAVEDLENDGGKVEAWVIGTEEYKVELELEKDKVTWHSCTCPYDMGPVCKHVVAVLFELSGLEKEEVKPKKRRGRPPKSSVEKIKTRQKKKTDNKKSKKPQFKTLIKELGEEELRQFIMDLASHDRNVKNRFMAFFSYKWSKGSKEDYKVIFRNTLRSYTGRYGFLDYSNSIRFSREIVGMMSDVPQWIKTSPYNALALCQAVVEEVHKVYEEGVDDSSGDFGGLSYIALDYLKQLSGENNPEVQEDIFNYCISESKNKVYSDYGDGWHEFMGIVIPLTDTLERKNQLFESLDEKLKRIENNTWSKQYYSEKIAKIKFKVLERLLPEEADELKRQNIRLPSFRQEAIANAFENKDYGTARELAAQGILDDKEKAGLVKQWKMWLYEIAVITEDEKAALKLAKDFFETGHKTMEDYHRLKKHFPKDKWDKEVIRILKKLSKGWAYGIANDICVEEQKWDILKKKLATNPRFSSLKMYGKYIAANIGKDELIEMYEKAVWSSLVQTGRNIYREVCQGIRQMKPFSTKKHYNELITAIKEEYPRRPALWDELNKL